MLKKTYFDKYIVFKYPSNKAYKVVREYDDYYIIRVRNGWFNGIQRVSKAAINIKLINYELKNG